MKIGFIGFNLAEGKVKYKDDRLADLEAKFEPKKVTPFFAEFVKEDLVSAEAFLVSKEKVLDLLIQDIEKLEGRMERSEDEAEKQVVKKCLESLEKEIPLCDVEFSEAEREWLKNISPMSMKPTLVCEAECDTNTFIAKVIEKAGFVFFYTVGKKEVHAWLVERDSDIVTCAGKIHSDLARGFIKAEIVNCAEFKDMHNMNDAKSKGLLNLVDKDYLIKDGDIVDIKFNV